MINLQVQFMPIPIPYESGPTRPMSAEESHLLLSIFVFLNIIWIITLIPEAYKYIKSKVNKNYGYYYYDFLDRWDGRYILLTIIYVLLDWTMLGTWIVIGIYQGGKFISHLI